MTEGIKLGNEKNSTNSMFLGEINLDKIIIPPTQSTEPRSLFEALGTTEVDLWNYLKIIPEYFM